MIQVTELGYMGLGVKDLAAWKEFAGRIMGFEVAGVAAADPKEKGKDKKKSRRSRNRSVGGHLTLGNAANGRFDANPPLR